MDKYGIQNQLNTINQTIPHTKGSSNYFRRQKIKLVHVKNDAMFLNDAMLVVPQCMFE